MSEKDEIQRLKKIGLSSSIKDVRKRTIDALSVYGKEAIPHINEILDSSISHDVVDYGLKKIESIEKKSKPPSVEI